MEFFLYFILGLLILVTQTHFLESNMLTICELIFFFFFLLMKSDTHGVRLNLEVSLVNKLAWLTLLMFCLSAHTLP